MTPVEWHDNEPTFPDFLPPLPKPVPVELRREDAEDRLERVLAAAGIKIDLWAVDGGSADMVVEFPDGAVYRGGEIINIVAEGYDHR